MTSSLSITKRLTADNQWEIIASVEAGGSLPQDIFIYENTGENSLGSYFGVCNLSEYQRLSLFEGTPIPKFGNRFVRSSSAKIKLDIKDDPELVINHIVNSVKSLSLAISNTTSITQIISIP